MINFQCKNGYKGAKYAVALYQKMITIYVESFIIVSQSA